MTRLCIIISLVFCSATLFAQGGVFRFEITSCDFGDIEESGGPVEHSFHFVNVSDRSQYIEAVIPSCSCTTVDYVREAVPPGGGCEVVVRYDPASLSGPFRQSVRLLSDRGRSQYRLTIEGNVLPRTRSIDELYPFYLCEGLQASTLSVRYGFVKKGKAARKDIGIVNVSDHPVALKYDAAGICIVGPDSLDAGCTATVRLEFLPEAAGTLDTFVYVHSGTRGKPIKVLGFGVEADETSKYPPSLRFEPTRAIFRRGRAETVLFNDGREVLKVIRLELPEGIVADLIPGESIKAGDSRKLKLHCLEFKGEAVARIYTNDPARPMREIICINN